MERGVFHDYTEPDPEKRPVYNEVYKRMPESMQTRAAVFTLCRDFCFSMCFTIVCLLIMLLVFFISSRSLGWWHSIDSTTK